MPRDRCTNEQIAFALRQAKNGTTVAENCRKIGVHRWKKQFSGMGRVEIRRLRAKCKAWPKGYVQLREEGIFGAAAKRGGKPPATIAEPAVGWNLCRCLLFAGFNHPNCGGRHATG